MFDFASLTKGFEVSEQPYAGSVQSRTRRERRRSSGNRDSDLKLNVHERSTAAETQNESARAVDSSAVAMNQHACNVPPSVSVTAFSSMSGEIARSNDRKTLHPITSAMALESCPHRSVDVTKIDRFANQIFSWGFPKEVNKVLPSQAPASESNQTFTTQHRIARGTCRRCLCCSAPRYELKTANKRL